MATPPLPALTIVSPPSEYGSDIDTLTAPASDYGSEFDIEEETLIGDLLTQISTTAPIEKTVIYRGQDAEAPEVLLHSSPPSALVRLATDASIELSPRRTRSAPVEVEYDRPSREAWSPSAKIQQPQASPSPDHIAAPAEKPIKDDIRSPLDRFRKKPKKPLSVTDLVSPAWCELQFWYTLTKHGRKIRTQAMKTGSKIHRTLEEQVHEIVPVQVQTREDGFGLKIWNTIQGLRALRETGLTRELQVWGVLNGEVVNGVIDEISYTCPDPEYEESVEKSKAEKAGGTLPLGQLNLQQAFANANPQTIENPWLGSLSQERTVYLADVKTRGAKSVPAGASLRPTWMQLMLYRKLLESLASNTVDAQTIFDRYNLSSLEPFTEAFMLQICGLDYGSDMDVNEEATSALLNDSEIRRHNNLLALWSLMISEFQHTISTFSDVLRAEFRYSKTGEVIGSELFTYDTTAIEKYIASEMEWWKGEREARGVDIEEAFKCRICEFAEECTWRKTKIEEATEKHRLRKSSRGKSAV